jgi:hypothetical protein
MTFGNGDDPTSRRRVDAEAFAEREQEIWRLHAAGYTVRAIARALACPRTTVHRVIQKMTLRDMTQQLIEAAGGGDRDGNPLDRDLLEMYRRAWHELEYGTPEQQAALREFREAADAYWSAHPAPDMDGQMSWAVGVARALANDSGTDPDNDEW